MKRDLLTQREQNLDSSGTANQGEKINTDLRVIHQKANRTEHKKEPIFFFYN